MSAVVLSGIALLASIAMIAMAFLVGKSSKGQGSGALGFFLLTCGAGVIGLLVTISVIAINWFFPLSFFAENLAPVFFALVIGGLAMLVVAMAV